jgi:sorting nexin-8
MRDLFTRHDRYSGDAVDRLRKRVETMTLRLAGVRSAQKDGWQGEADRLAQSIEHDQAAISVQLARRVFIRHTLWHELRVVLHNRENTLLVLAVQELGRDEREFAEVGLATWNAFAEEVEGMPLE